MSSVRLLLNVWVSCGHRCVFFRASSWSTPLFHLLTWVMCSQWDILWSFLCFPLIRLSSWVGSLQNGSNSLFSVACTLSSGNVYVCTTPRRLVLLLSFLPRCVIMGWPRVLQHSELSTKEMISGLLLQIHNQTLPEMWHFPLNSSGEVPCWA